jgi:hypothetical protein
MTDKVKEARENAERIIKEAEKAVENRKKEIEVEIKDKMYQSRIDTERETQEKRTELMNFDKKLSQKENHLEKKGEQLERRDNELHRREREVVVREKVASEKIEQYEQTLRTAREQLERISGMSPDEAKKHLMKLMEGGYIPLSLGALLVLMMVTWRRGTQILTEKTHKENIPLADLLSMLEHIKAATVPGTAVFLTSDPDIAPTSLMHNLKHNKVLHETNVILTVQTEPQPRVPEERRVTLEKLSEHMYRAALHFGYMETPNVSKALGLCRKQGILKFDIMSTSFFLGRRIIKSAPNSGMPVWQDKLFIALAENATNATEFYHSPSGRVVELGSQITV